jgi:membrane protein insertase Oxa1/YidC/SpoIIIJ
MELLWNELMFRPLLNLLIGIYNTIGKENLGIAIIWLTFVVRFFLLPLSLKDEERREKEKALQTDLADLRKRFANNPAVLRDEQRAAFRKYHIRRWPKIIVLGVQGAILVVLYRVFIGGINISTFVDALYSFVHVPVQIHTDFIGIDIAKRSYILSSLCGLLLFANIWLDHQLSNRPWRQADLMYLFGFPLFTFIILAILPGVKALFILTSMIFSDTLLIVETFRESIKEQDRIIAQKDAETFAKSQEKPHQTERFR